MPFQIGNQLSVGNGRPKKPYSITEAFKKLLKAKPHAKRLIVEKVYQMALKGDPTAIKLVWAYMDGMPQQDITSAGESIIPHVAISTLRPKQIKEPTIKGNIVDTDKP